MKQLFTILSFCFPLLAIGQNFEISPSNEIYREFQLGEYTSETVSVKNTSGEEMTILFETLSNTFPDGWDGALCAGIDCFFNIPPNGNLLSVANGAESEMGFTFNLFDDTGEGTILIRVYNEANEAVADTFSITYNVSSPTSTYQVDNDFNFSSSPNPTIGILNIHNDQLDNYQVLISSLTGQFVLNEKVVGKSWSGDIADLPAGIYVLTVFNEDGLVFREKVQKM